MIKILKNLMEEVVINEIKDSLSFYEDICKCEKCKEDMAAIALNNLRPVYVVTEKGYLYGKVNSIDSQSKADVTGAVINAIEIVSKKPQHD